MNNMGEGSITTTSSHPSSSLAKYTAQVSTVSFLTDSGQGGMLQSREKETRSQLTEPERKKEMFVITCIIQCEKEKPLHYLLIPECMETTLC